MLDTLLLSRSDNSYVDGPQLYVIRVFPIFISVINQLDAQNLFHNKFYFMPLHVSSTCAHHQDVKIALHNLWYYHTYRWPSRAREIKLIVKQILCINLVKYWDKYTEMHGQQNVKMSLYTPWKDTQQ